MIYLLPWEETIPGIPCRRYLHRINMAVEIWKNGKFWSYLYFCKLKDIPEFKNTSSKIKSMKNVDSILKENGYYLIQEHEVDRFKKLKSLL